MGGVGREIQADWLMESEHQGRSAGDSERMVVQQKTDWRRSQRGCIMI